ncbi:MAG: DnaD domain protein [Eubacteriaceae bacterium]|nr:DnaD domain protein [Eubacteriaceae bacterium]
MRFISEQKSTEYLFNTSVENIFINEYMPMAPEGYVKVFLLARMYMDSGNETDIEEMGKTLSMTVENVEKALIYWAKQGLITRNPGGIEFISLKEKLYGKTKSKERVSSKGKELLDNTRLKELFDQLQKITGTVFTGSDINEVASWVDEIKATREVILGAAGYCKERNKTNIRYIGSVVKDWTGKGLATGEDVENHLEDADRRHYVFRRVMRALGFNRNATEEERRIITEWLDDLGCSMDEILTACRKTSGISNPNINYINAVLRGNRGLKEDKKEVSKAVVQQYYGELRKEAESAARERKTEVISNIPRIGQIEKDMIDCSSRLTQVMIAGGTDKLSRIDSLKVKIAALEDEKTRVLTENNIPVDYMDVRYKCSKCGDTGTTEAGAKCECWLTRSKEAQEWYRAEHSKAGSRG